MPSRVMKGYRALDLTDEKGMLCGKILAELGVDVIKVERPGGDASRMIPPYYHNEEDPEKSLFWYSYNINKRGITLDLESEEGKELFKKMVAQSDFVIESFAPGYMKSIGLGYEELAKVKPEIIMASITPFGQEGPMANLPVKSDLTIQALATMLKRMGDPDRAPIQISQVPQSWLHGCMDAAEGIMIANYYRNATGKGQYIDCAILESVIGDPVAIGDFNVGGKEAPRPGSTYTSAGKHTTVLWKCKDGFVYFQIRGGNAGLKTNPNLCAWMAEENMCPDFMKEKDWAAFDWFKTTQEELDALEEAISAFFLSHTKDELMNGAVSHNFLLGKVSDTADLIKDEQFNSRDFWIQINYDDLGDITYPGPFAKFSETPLVDYFRAPHIGEHNQAVYEELCGLSADDVEGLKAKGII